MNIGLYFGQNCFADIFYISTGKKLFLKQQMNRINSLCDFYAVCQSQFQANKQQINKFLSDDILVSSKIIIFVQNSMSDKSIKEMQFEIVELQLLDITLIPPNFTHINIGVSSQQQLFYWKARSMRVQPQLDFGYDQNNSNSRLSIKKQRSKSKYENKAKKFRSFIWNQSFLYKIKSNSFPNFTIRVQGNIKNKFENLNFHSPKQTTQNQLQDKYICSLVLTDVNIQEICNKQKQEIIKYFMKDNKRVARLIFKASLNNSLDIKQGIFTPSLSLKPNNHWNFYKFRKENKQFVFKTDKKTKIRPNRINTVLYCCGCIDFQNQEKKSESSGKYSCNFD